MKTTISHCFKLSIFLLITLTPYAYADAQKLPTSKKVDKEDVIEIIPEIKIETGATSVKKDPKLKEGKTCNFDDLEEAKGEEFIEIPMAETIPCSTVDCKDLKPAVLHNDNYKKLKDAKTIAGCDK